jgi:long-chain acyl-CoA synthetase
MIETLEPTGTVIRTDLGRGEPLYADEPRTLAELFAGAAQKHELAAALNYKRSGEWRSISSGEMVTRAGNIALGLYSLGLRRGDKAAILSSNSPEWTLFDAGCQFAGVIDVPIYTTTSPSSIEYILNDARPRVFFLENKEMFDRVVPFVDRCDSLECFVLSDDTGVRHEKAITLAELERRGAALGQSEPELLDGMIASCDPDEIATLIYTSGTTG